VKDSRPVVLIVEQEFRDLAPLSVRLARGPLHLATCPLESVALEYVAESRPAAVLLDARTLYLEGPDCLARWTAASPGTRVLFIDEDGPWCLLMELPGADSAQVTINPCDADGIAAAVEELLSCDPGAAAGGREPADDQLAVLAV
jgi:DNA-binding NtrC family response regulator